MRTLLKTKKIIQVIHYIVSCLDNIDKIKIIKLIYLADKYHCIHYGRTVTRDDYYAMRLGPVASTVKNVLDLDEISLSSPEYEYATKLIEKSGYDIYSYITKNKEQLDYDMLSESDIEALDFVINCFGNKTNFELSEYTHKYPEWYQHEELFEKQPNARGDIELFELVSLINNDDPIGEGLTSEQIEQSKLMLIGDFS